MTKVTKAADAEQVLCWRCSKVVIDYDHGSYDTCRDCTEELDIDDSEAWPDEPTDRFRDLDTP